MTRKISTLLFAVLCAASALSGQPSPFPSGGNGTQTFNATGTFTVPTGVNRVWVQVWGAGGGGAGGAAANGGSGGPGGGYAELPCAVTPGSAIAVTIGAGGTGGAVGVVGVAGGSSIFGSCVTVTGGLAQVTTGAAQAGGRSVSQFLAIYVVSGTAPANAGAICITANGTAFTPFFPTRGGCSSVAPTADGVGVIGGAGIYGGAGGGTGAFGLATTRVGGSGGGSGYGGVGGAGASVTNGTPNADCVAGTQPGGGGGGGAGSAGSQSAGCAGGAGRVIVWW